MLSEKPVLKCVRSICTSVVITAHIQKRVWKKLWRNGQVRCELMSGITEFLRRRCRHLQHADLPLAAVWLTYVDRQLTGRGWQVLPFLGPSSLVFVYMLARQAVSTDIHDVDELRTVLLACLYVAYAYIGSEISYPIKVCGQIYRVGQKVTPFRVAFLIRCIIFQWCKQDFFQDEAQDRDSGASRRRPSSGGLHHCYICIVFFCLLLYHLH